MTRQARIPLALKLAYTLFVAILVPYYWVTYSAWNFLFFCDLALLMTLPALWLESSLLISIPAVGLALPQLLWVADFLTGVANHDHDQLHVRSQVTTLRAGAVRVPRLAAVLVDLGSLAIGLRSSGIRHLDGHQHRGPARLLFSRPRASRSRQQSQLGCEH